MTSNKRINHRFTRVDAYEPEYDYMCMFVDVNKRILIENKAAREDANIIFLFSHRR